MQTKQNHINIFCKKNVGEQTDSAVPLINLLERFTFNNVYRLHVLSFTHLWHKNLLSNVFYDFFRTLVVYIISILDTPVDKISTNHESEQTPGNRLWLPSFGTTFLLIWKILMCTVQFYKQIKLYLLSELLKNIMK